MQKKLMKQEEKGDEKRKTYLQHMMTIANDYYNDDYDNYYAL